MPDLTRKFVDYDGLKLYDTLNKQWTLDQIDKTNWTEAQIRALAFEEIKNYFDAAREYGQVNDIRSYPSYEYFPTMSMSREGDEPSSDVQYIAMDTAIEYQWQWDDEETKTGHYVAINATTSKSDIEDLFK